MMALSSMVCIPLWICIQLWKTEGTILEVMHIFITILLHVEFEGVQRKTSHIKLTLELTTSFGELVITKLLLVYQA